MITGQGLQWDFGPYYPIKTQQFDYGVPPVWSDRLALLRDQVFGPAIAFRREMYADGGGFPVVPATTDNVVAANTNAGVAPTGFIDRSFWTGLLVGGGLYLARRILASRKGGA